MTNGEKLKEVFPNMRIDVFESYVQVVGENYEFNNLYPLKWWNAEYKEPTTKNDEVIEGCECFTCKYGDWKRKGWSLDMADDKCGGCCSWNDKYELIEPTTKNDLGVDAISRADARKAIIDHQYSNNFCEEHNIDWSINTSMALIALSDLTPVTPIRPKGQWEHGKELCKEYQGRILVDVTYADWHCSNCNYVIKGTVKPKWNYCPNCGTDMREVEG